MSKTERILSYLPPIYRPARDRSPLRAVVDSVGRRLLEAENLLFEVMRAHWVDFADQGGDQIRDLARLAALFGLAPRDDEDVETFRMHLKSYIQSYLRGTATPPGILRLAASTLALSLEEDLEPAPGDRHPLVELHPRGDDAAVRLLGFRTGEARGNPPAPARLVGTRDLSKTIELGDARELLLSIDGDTIGRVKFDQLDPREATVWDVARLINSALGDPDNPALPAVAGHDGHTLELRSRVPGPDGEIEIGSPSGDASDALLGTAPRSYQGADARSARVTGTRDHAPFGGIPVVDLSRVRYLRLALDGGAPFEIDCAGDDPQATTLDEVCQRINSAAGATVATHDGHRLSLASPTTGPSSRLELHPAPANDARDRLLGPGARRINRGAVAAPARLVGRADLRAAIDLRVHGLLHLTIDGQEREIDFSDPTRANPAGVTAAEIVERLNQEFGATVASTDGQFITLTSPTTGAGGLIEILIASDPAKDAASLILGVVPRTYRGTSPTRARLEGLALFQAGATLDLRLQRRLYLSVDSGPLLAIDCAGPDPEQTTLQQAADAINDAAGTTVAIVEEVPGPETLERLQLQSPSVGATSAIVVRAPDEVERRFFYTRARVREDAATALFGFAAADIRGRLPEPARLQGTADLRRGADLRVTHTLRLQVDDHAPLDIRVANPERPMVTLLEHIVDTINSRLKAERGIAGPVASLRDGRLELTSPTEGPEGRIRVGASTASDAGPALFGLAPGSGSSGRDPERVVFAGMGDLARGLDVSTTYRLRVAIDDRPLTEIDLRNAVPAGSPPILSPGQVAAAINQSLIGDYASHDGRHIILASKKTGNASRVRIEPIAPNDATQAVFGLNVAREYVGQEGAAARLSGAADLSEGVDLRERRHLSLEVDGTLVADIDCAGRDTGPSQLANIMARINTALNLQLNPAFKNARNEAERQQARKEYVGQVDGRLFVQSATVGAASAVVLRQSSAADARRQVLGDAPAEAYGKAGQPAVLTGNARLSRPLDLGKRSLIKLRVDEGEIRTIDCAGTNPARTFIDEAIERINAVFPGLARLDDQRRLVLSAARRVELLGLRHFSLFEFAPVPVTSPEQEIRHGTGWTVFNESVRDEPFEWTLRSLSGVDRPRLTAGDSRAWVQFSGAVPAGSTLRVRHEPNGRLAGTLETPGLPPRNVSDRLQGEGGDALLLPVGESRWHYSDCYGDRYNEGYYGSRRRRTKLKVLPARYAGGASCHAPGVYNQSRFYDPDTPGTESVYAAKGAVLRAQATSSFRYEVHRAGNFELELPADLPPQFGGRYGVARYAASRRDESGNPAPDGQIPENVRRSYTYFDAIFDQPEDPQALDEQIKHQPGPVLARVELIPDAGVPIYAVPFKTDRPLVGGDATNAARCYLTQPGVEGVVELKAREPGEWGNLIRVSAPESEVPGAFNVTILYTGQEVYENARQKVAEQVAFARAAGIAFTVTRR